MRKRALPRRRCPSLTQRLSPARRYLQKDGQDATVGSLKPIQCYGKRGPIKQMDKPGIKAILMKKEL